MASLGCDRRVMETYFQVLFYASPANAVHFGIASSP